MYLAVAVNLRGRRSHCSSAAAAASVSDCGFCHSKLVLIEVVARRMREWKLPTGLRFDGVSFECGGVANVGLVMRKLCRIEYFWHGL